MTPRLYLMAHAPAEPQSWFEPAMPTKCPPYRYFGDINGRREEFKNRYDAERAVGPGQVITDSTDGDAYCREANRQRYIQWPAAWADAVLAASGLEGEAE